MIDLDFKNAVDLADFREGFVPRGSGPLGLMKIIYALCTKLAEAKGWDLEAALPAALEQRKTRFAQEEAERARNAAEQAKVEQAKRTRNYIKKHGHMPPTQADRDSALAKLTPLERKALGL